MMTVTNFPQDSMTDDHLESMLYLLQDPVLDRDAFEARLVDDAQLGEILAQAVTTFQSLQTTKFESEAIAQPSLSRIAAIQTNPLSQWRWVSVLAASILLAGFLGWQTLWSMRSGSTENGPSNVVLAWGDMQSDALDLRGTRDVFDIELDNTLTTTDTNGEINVPEWLVMAATDTAEGVDSDNGKAIIQ